MSVYWVCFLLGLLFGVTMTVEGCLIVLNRPVTPVPVRVLYGLSVLVYGREGSRVRFPDYASLKGLREYAATVLVFGPLLITASLVFLFSVVL